MRGCGPRKDSDRVRWIGPCVRSGSVFFPAWKPKMCVKRVYGLFWVFFTHKKSLSRTLFQICSRTLFCFHGHFFEISTLSRTLFWFHAHFFVIFYFHGDFFPFHGHFFRLFSRKGILFSREKEKHCFRPKINSQRRRFWDKTREIACSSN